MLQIEEDNPYIIRDEEEQKKMETRRRVMEEGPKARVKVVDDIPENGVSGAPGHWFLGKGREYEVPHVWAKEAEKRGLIEILEVLPMGKAELAYVQVRRKGFEWMGLKRNYNVRLCMELEDAERLEESGDIKINKKFTGDANQVTR